MALNRSKTNAHIAHHRSDSSAHPHPILGVGVRLGVCHRRAKIDNEAIMPRVNRTDLGNVIRNNGVMNITYTYTNSQLEAIHIKILQ